jgi:predicted lysophospholipase L1 biosynthesis ABC-type transport system permease subunit
VQPDLIGLEFSKGELRRLTGVDPDDVFRPSILQNRKKRFRFFLNEILICLALSPIVIGFIYTFIVIPLIGSSSYIAIALLIVVPIIVAAVRFLWRKKTCPEVLMFVSIPSLKLNSGNLK